MLLVVSKYGTRKILYANLLLLFRTIKGHCQIKYFKIFSIMYHYYWLSSLDKLAKHLQNISSLMQWELYK